MRYIKIYSFLFLYIFSCISLVIDFHYCGGTLVSVDLFHTDEAGCCGDEEKNVPGCCQDQLLVVDTDDTEGHTTYTVKNTEVVKYISAYSPVSSLVADHHLMLEKLVIPINHAPPNSLAAPLFIKNCVLLI